MIAEQPNEDTKHGTPNTKHPDVVWLVRHAETAAPTVFHGAESDVELGEHGRRQVHASLDWFAALKPTAVVSSAMRRALDTAAPIAAACGVPHLVEPLLHERFVGPLSERPRAEGDAIWEQTARQWIAGNTAYAFPGMESFDALRDRTLPAFRRVVEAHPGGRVVIVAHGVVCKVLLLSLVRGRSSADWVSVGRILNMSVSEIVPDGDLWAARRLLEVPPPVLAVNAAFADSGEKTAG